MQDMSSNSLTPENYWVLLQFDALFMQANLGHLCLHLAYLEARVWEWLSWQEIFLQAQPLQRLDPKTLDGDGLQKAIDRPRHLQPSSSGPVAGAAALIWGPEWECP